MQKISLLWQQLFNRQTTCNKTSIKWKKGKGTENDPYQIETVEQLTFLAETTNEGTSYETVYFKLMNNLNLSGAPFDVPRRNWTPIGLDDIKRQF